jgi:Skp family chaperone for outer membrane proteins
MSIQAILAIIAGAGLLVSLASILVMLGRVLQRLDGVERAQASSVDCNACRPEVLQRLKTSEARTKELEADRKAHGELLAKMGAEWTALRETLDEVKKAMGAIATNMRRA